MSRIEEVNKKVARMRNLLDERDLEAVWVSEPQNIAWLTEGGYNRVDVTSPWGSFGILLTRTDKYVVAASNESYRIMNEEVFDLGFELVSYDWNEGYNDLIVENMMAGKRVGSDRNQEFAVSIAQDMTILRSQLNAREKNDYRKLANETAEILHHVLGGVRKGQTELQIAGRIAEGFISKGILPQAIFVASDERRKECKHPIPSSKKVKEIVSVSICGMRNGLVVSQTREIALRKLSEEEKKDKISVLKVDLAYFENTKPEKLSGQILQSGIDEYAIQGWPDEWKKHHQGGRTGYLGREYVATPESDDLVLCDQAFAWNPTINGFKSEETFFLDGNKPEIIGLDGEWPMIEIEYKGKKYIRPDVMIIKGE
ncbi:aminopeptidase P family N-terminal domain-containing protein [Clostridia bacterium]|nr:aminopeptidase P family N-terminal domain-containing protein [Clostridia bacterium]